MKSIDKEIFEVENRLHRREAFIRQTAGQARKRALKSLKSPAAIGGAVLLGFLVAGRVRRGRARSEPVSRETKEQSKGLALGTLLMTGASWFIRSQFGGPVGLARFVVSKIKGKAGGAPPAYQ